MPALSTDQILEFLRQGDEAPTAVEKGRAFENLTCYVFGAVPGITITMRNALNVFESEEIDVAFWNDLDPNGFDFLPRIILVECKNWSRTVGAQDVSWFDSKLQARGLGFGILIAARGITGDAAAKTAAHKVVSDALGDQRQIIMFSREELQALTDTDTLVRNIKEKLCELVVTGTVFP
jgi:hypothetical protein